MAGGSEGLAALKAHLMKGAYKDSLSTLSDVTTFVRKCYPSQDVQLVEVAAEQDMTKTRTGPEKRTGKRTEFGIVPRLQSVSAHVISCPDVHGERILSDLAPIQIGQGAGEASDAINAQWCIPDVACKNV